MPVRTHRHTETGLPGLQLSKGVRVKTHHRALSLRACCSHPARQLAGPHLLPFLRYHGPGQGVSLVFLWRERHPAGPRQENGGGRAGTRTLVLLLDALDAKVKGHIPL